MTTQTLLIVLALPLLLAGAAVCSSVETALFSLTYQDRLRLRRTHPRAAASTGALLSRPREVLVSVLLINMIITTVYFLLTSLLLLSAEHPAVGVGLSVVNLLAMTVLAEVVSKMLAARRRIEFARWLSGPTLAVVRGLGPVRTFLEQVIIAPLARLVLPRGHCEKAGELSPAELSALLTHGSDEGVIDDREERVLRQVIHLGELRVRDIMTPRVDLVWVNEDAGVDEVVALARSRRLTRLPVVRPPRRPGGGAASSTGNTGGNAGSGGGGGAGGGGLDGDIVGVLDVKTFLLRHAQGRPVRVRDAVQAALFVPERATLDKLLEQLRASGRKLALCVDEHGAIVGALTVEDVASCLIAELEGTAGDGDASPVQLVGLGVWAVPGRLSARDWLEMFDLPVDRRAATVAGLVFAHLGRVPTVGERVRIGNLELRVSQMRGRSVEQVLVSLAGTEADAAPAGAPGPAGQASGRDGGGAAPEGGGGEGRAVR